MLTVTAEPVFTVIGNVEPSPFVNVITLLTALAVVNNEAVLTVAPAFKANDAVTAKLADVELFAYDALVAFIANELVVDTKAYDADVDVLLYDELTALDAVTLTDVIVEPKPVCNSLPLI